MLSPIRRTWVRASISSVTAVPRRAGGRLSTDCSGQRGLGDVPGGGESGGVGCPGDGVVLLLAVAQVDLLSPSGPQVRSVAPDLRQRPWEAVVLGHDCAIVPGSIAVETWRAPDWRWCTGFGVGHDVLQGVARAHKVHAAGPRRRRCRAHISLTNAPARAAKRGTSRYGANGITAGHGLFRQFPAPSERRMRRLLIGMGVNWLTRDVQPTCVLDDRRS